MQYSPRSILVALSAGSLVLAACGGGSESESAASLPPVAADSTDFNDADVLFAQSMIPHHREAIAMADMALATDVQANADVVALATQIKGAQDPEIAQMTTLLQAWGQPLDMPGMESGETMDGMEGMEGMEGMDGMMSAEAMTALAALTGAEFDTAWASAMIAHHEGAVSMAQTVKAAGSNPEVLTLADAIITGQQAEIDQMKALIGG